MSNTQRISLLEPLEREVLIAGDDIEGRYVLKAKLGEGGMGVVFLAQQVSTRRDVALKVMKLDKVDETNVERFRQEIDIISGLSHPNIVRVFDTGRIQKKDLVYVVMELVDGISLNEVFWYKHDEQEYYKCHMDVGMALEIAYQVCAALTEPHMQGIIHRDIKPENLIIVPRSDETLHVKVLDFGVARVLSSKKRVTDTRIPFVGTPHYMAPEQVASSQYDARTDLYAVGVMLYELLCGQYPFDDENLLALLLRKTQYEPPPLNEQPGTQHLPAEVIKLVHELLARDPDNRPSDAIEVRHRIDDIRDKHQFKRIRVPTRALLAEQAPLANSAQAVERLQRLFRPWLKLPTGRSLEEYLDNPVGSPAAAVPQFSPAEEVDEEADIPTNIAEPPQFDLSEESQVAPKVERPVQHHMQAWHVAEGWTDSFDVSNLKRDFKDMEELFEGPTGHEEEEIEEAITTLYTADKLESVLDGYSEMSFDDPPSFGDIQPARAPFSPHHTPSPLSAKPLQFSDDDMDPTIREIGSVGEILKQMELEGAALALEVSQGLDASGPASFAPLHDERDDILTSIPKSPSMIGGAELPMTAEGIKLLAPPSREDARSMADTVEVDPVVASAALDELPEQEPFIPSSFNSDGFERSGQEQDSESEEQVDAFADTMLANADAIKHIDPVDDAMETFEDLPRPLNLPRKAPTRVETPAPRANLRDEQITGALAPQFGAVSIDADEAQSLQIKAVEILSMVNAAQPAAPAAEPKSTPTQTPSMRPSTQEPHKDRQLSSHYEAKIDLNERPTTDEPAGGSNKAMLIGVIAMIVLAVIIAAAIGLSN